MDDRLGFLILLGKVYANLNVATFNLVVDGLADIMQQTCTACRNRIEAEFAGHHAGNVCHLDGVLQDVLTITGAVAQAAENLDQLRMNAVDAGLEGSTLAFALDDLLNLTASLVNHFLNASRMNTTVNDQLFEGQTCDLTANRIERGQGDSFGRIVDDEVYAGKGFQRADIASLSADNAALHLVVRQRNDRNGRLGYLIGGTALNCGRDNLAGGLLALVLQALIDLAQLDGCIVGCFVFNGLDEHIACFVTGHAGNLLQLFYLLELDALEFFLFLLACVQLAAKVIILAVEHIALLVQCFLALNQAALKLLGLIAAFLQLAVGFDTLLVDFVLCLEYGFAFFGLAGLDRFVDDAGGLGLGRADLFFRNALAIQESDDYAYCETHDTGDDRYDDVAHVCWCVLLFTNFGRRHKTKTIPQICGAVSQ